MMSPNENAAFAAATAFVDKPSLGAEGYLRPKDAWNFLGIGRSSFYAMQQKGSNQFVESFPKPYLLSGRTKVWSKAELISWVESRQVTNQGGAA